MSEKVQKEEVGATESKINVPVQNETNKPNRRGVGAARGSQRLKFDHRDAMTNGLFLGHLESVSLESISIGEDKTGMPSFNGMEIPKLIFTFTSNEEDAAKRKYVMLQFTAVESNVNTIPGGKNSWYVDRIMDYFKHLLNVYLLRGRELTNEEEAALSLPFEDFDEKGEYISLEPEVVINGWKILFENIDNIFNRGKDGNPIFKSKDGKHIPLWIKLLRFTKGKGVWRSVVSGNSAGDLGFNTFVGEGCIEIQKQNTPPSIRINAINECIIPMNIEKPKSPNMNPNVPQMPGAMVGVPIQDNVNGDMGYNTNINMDASSDLPF